MSNERKRHGQATDSAEAQSDRPEGRRYLGEPSPGAGVDLIAIDRLADLIRLQAWFPIGRALAERRFFLGIDPGADQDRSVVAAVTWADDVPEVRQVDAIEAYRFVGGYWPPSEAEAARRRGKAEASLRRWCRRWDFPDHIDSKGRGYWLK